MAKNIVLLSDGTGNSAAKLLKTNVWRIYEALKLSDPTKQVACYDDGVGTSSFKPLALLGGGFGVGLARNVLRLYRFLCEHYEPGDRIYAFGFSRGAFTIRILIGLICDQGIIKTRPPVCGPLRPDLPVAPEAAVHAGGTAAATAVVDPVDLDDAVFGAELARLALWAYRDFRKQFNQTGKLVTFARAVRDFVLQNIGRLAGHEPYDKKWNRHVDSIAFVGVWDTVDAYGLPIDELTDGIDRWIWPLSMPEFRLSKKVKKGCHVLALDDERNTFHPVLWDEEEESQSEENIKDERISQVWFAGMHSNVGGGYPDDALSCVSLNWMTRQAHDAGLLFWPELLEHHVAKADPLGRIYDSRSGLKSYYRYNPRKMKWLTNGQVHEKGFFNRRWPDPWPTVTVVRPKIHESVLERIAAAPEAYAPIVLPDRYAVVMSDGRILDGQNHPFETETQMDARSRAQEAVWDLVWWKRAVYFATVAVSLWIVLRPFQDAAEDIIRTSDRGTAGKLILMAGDLLPAFASPWVRYYAAQPGELAGSLSLLLVLMYLGTRLQGAICGKMRGLWLRLTAANEHELEALKAPVSLLYKIRSHHVYQGAFAVLRRKLLPMAFGITTLFFLAGAANRIPFEIVNGLGAYCGAASTVTPLRVDESRTVSFESADVCTPAGIRIEAGARYRIDLRQGPDEWKDADIAVPFPEGLTPLSAGLSVPQRVVLTLFAPFRRQWSSRWFVPIARVGTGGMDHYRLSHPTNEITAQTSGDLYLFVNDAIAPIGLLPPSLGWSSYYKNNHGSAIATITKIAK